MAHVQISRAEMLKRVAHFQELKPMDYKAMGMSNIPEGIQAFSIIGQVAKGVEPTIPTGHGFNTAIVKANPGKGSPLHTHATVEVFVPLSGQWTFFWGDKGKEEEVSVGPWDTISFPSGVMHGFRNVGNEDACLMAIVGGTEVGEIAYASQE